MSERGKTIGIVIIHRDGDAGRYLLLHHGGDYWNVPKGRPEPNETELQTALRELQEETGITQVEVDPEFRYEYDYDFDSEIADGTRERIYKHAIFFLGFVNDEAVTISKEHVDFGWYDYGTALQRMYKQTGRDLLKHAEAHFRQKQPFVL